MTGGYRTGLVLAATLGAFDVISLALTNGDNPPYAIAATDAVLGLATLTGVARLWRQRPGTGWFWTVITTRALSALSAVPAYFAAVPAGLLVLVTVFLALTATTLGLLLTTRRTATP